MDIHVLTKSRHTKNICILKYTNMIFTRIYDVLSDVYNGGITRLIPYWVQLLSPNIRQIGYIKPVFDSCYNFVSNMNTTKNPIIQKIEDKPNNERIPKNTRKQVWRRYHGNNEMGICYCCGHMLYYDSWQCSHVIARAKGGGVDIDNLRTCCMHCNFSMGDANLYAYVRDKGLKGPARKHVNNYFRNHPSQKHDKRSTRNNRNDFI